MKSTGAEILVEALKREGVDVIFGYPGGQVLPIYDALYSGGLRHILVRHEQAAAHAADGYAKATGRTGVCLATSGPGATNLVTGIATAYMDSVPMVAITGQVVSASIGRDAFQEADITGITLPITKHSYLVKDTADIPRVIKEAFYIASTGRPGPVVVDLPKDLQASTALPLWPDGVDIPSYKPTYQGHPKQIHAAAKAIVHSSRPILYLGGGASSSGAIDQVLKLAELVSMPVVTTLMGIGAFPSGHRLSLGMIGMHGTVAANTAITECDLLIAVGARFDDRATGDVKHFAPGAKVIHIDIDPAEIGKNVRVNIPIVGDARSVLDALIADVEAMLNREGYGTESGDNDSVRKTWAVACAVNKSPSAQGQGQSSKEGEIKPQDVITSLHRLTGGDAIVATEVGQHQMWTAMHWHPTGPRRFITSGGLGTMGYGLPSAIGAQIGMPDAVVVDIAGDGSFQMNMQELATLKAYNLPVKVVILNNGCLGLVRQWQEMFYQGRYSHIELAGTPDFAKLAEAYGMPGLVASTPDEVDDVLAKGLAAEGPVVMEFKVAAGENVLPMVPPGGNIAKMIGLGGGQP